MRSFESETRSYLGERTFGLKSPEFRPDATFSTFGIDSEGNAIHVEAEGFANDKVGKLKFDVTGYIRVTLTLRKTDGLLFQRAALAEKRMKAANRKKR